jgi:Protein of unknown function (DUF4089)
MRLATERSERPRSPTLPETEPSLPPPFDAEAYLDQASRLLGLHVPTEYRRSVATNIVLLAQMAELVMGLPLATTDEPAPVFLPGERRQ